MRKRNITEIKKIIIKYDNVGQSSMAAKWPQFSLILLNDKEKILAETTYKILYK